MSLRSLLVFCFILSIKVLAFLFYTFKVNWGKTSVAIPQSQDQWNKVRLIVFLNHTSLFEPLFTSIFPIHQLWRASQKLIGPGADITMARPIVGKFYRQLGPHIIPVSRRRDATWQNFIDHIKKDSLVVILPEGRMKRRNGLDKKGRPMSVRSGVLDVIEKIDDGHMLVVVSGGLHHIQAPGEYFPKIFKTITASLELHNIQEFKETFTSDEILDFFQKKLPTNSN